MRENISRKHKSDYLLALVIFALTIFGLIAIYSVSKYYSLQLTDNATDKFYLKKQLLWVTLGIGAWIVTSAIDYRFWQKYSKYMLWITVILLILPLIFGHQEARSSTRWINLGIGSFQPSELAKLTMIFYLAGFFSTKKTLEQVAKASGPFFIFMTAISFLMLMQRDLGTLIVMVGIGISIFVASGVAMKYILYGVGYAGILGYLAIKIEPYRMARLLTFLNPDNDSLGAGYHVRNALIAIGSGGMFGLGFGQSKQKYLYLPEAHTDSIFAIISEELGFFRASLIILAFGFIAQRGYRIAREAPDEYSRFVATGITTWLIFQAFINIGAMLSIMPLTGVPLPFISYGGSSLIFILASTGVLINISKFTKNGKRI